MSDKCFMYMLMCQLLPLSHLATQIKHSSSSQRELNTIYLPRNCVLAEHLPGVYCTSCRTELSFWTSKPAVIENILLFHVCCFPRVRLFCTKIVLNNIQVKWWNNLMAGGGNTAPFITVTVMTALYKWEKLTNTISDISEWTENSVFLLKTHNLKCLGILQFGYPMLF